VTRHPGGGWLSDWKENKFSHLDAGKCLTWRLFIPSGRAQSAR